MAHRNDYKAVSLRERFEAFILPVTESGCFLWIGCCDTDGYGVFKAHGFNWKAPRMAYLLAYGPFPLELHVLHKCDIPCCVNPKHLFLGTNTDNIQDRNKKGRAWYTPENKLKRIEAKIKLLEAQV